MSEAVHHTAHYGGDTTSETIKVLEVWLTPEQFIGFCRGNALKYLSGRPQGGCRAGPGKGAVVCQPGSRVPKGPQSMSLALRQYHQRACAACRLIGVCIQCRSDKAAPCRTKCAQCLAIEAQRRPRIGCQRFRFTEADRAEILHRYGSGESEADIAKKFLCHRSTIHRVLVTSRQPLRRAA